MGRGSKLKISVLACVFVFFLGLWCTASATHLYRTTSESVLVEARSVGPAYFCSGSFLAGSELLLTAPQTGDLSGGGKLSVASDFSVFSALDGLSIQAGSLSGRDRQAPPKVSLHILNSVFILLRRD